MKNVGVRAVVFILLALVVDAVAVHPAEAVIPAPPEFGRLFRVSKTGVPDSFVLGTLHAAAPRVESLAPSLIAALAKSRTLAVEMVPEERDGQMLELEQLENGERLQPLIGAAAYAEVRERLVALSMPEASIERLKPWAAMMRVARTPGASISPECAGDCSGPAVSDRRYRLLPRAVRHACAACPRRGASRQRPARIQSRRLPETEVKESRERVRACGVAERAVRFSDIAADHGESRTGGFAEGVRTLRRADRDRHPGGD